MYALIQEIKNDAINIVTLEDPIEYKMEGVNQIQVNPDVGLTFATGLRSILRQDPDVMMVGEIRDKETAELAVQASLDRPPGFQHAAHQLCRRHLAAFA